MNKTSLLKQKPIETTYTYMHTQRTREREQICFVKKLHSNETRTLANTTRRE
jgi:hypothetical protein